MSGTNTTTYTDGTPTVPELYSSFGMASSQIGRQIFRPADSIVMRPERWGWVTSSLDTQNRPLVVPTGMPALNVVAGQKADASESVVGTIQGLDVVVDANLPNNLGVGTNQDQILVGRFQEFWLFEGALHSRALMEVLSGTLQVRLQAYNYVAFLPDRYPAALTTIGGTGLIMPAGW